MTWSLSASGHTNTEQEEAELSRRLNDVLADPKSGTTTSQFYGQYAQGPVHLSDKSESVAPADAADAADDQPEAAAG